MALETEEFAFRAVDHGELVPRQEGYYTSFPSLCQDVQTDDILLLYRTARFDPEDDRPGMLGHGLDGHLYLKRLNPQTMALSEATRLMDGDQYPPGLIDGFLTNLGDKIYLSFRRFPHPEMPVFYTLGPSLDRLMMPMVFPLWPKLDRGAQWGRLVIDGTRLLQACYGTAPDLRDQLRALDHDPKQGCMRPALFESLDNGNSWRFVNWITPEPLLEKHLTATETHITLINGRLYALIRAQGEHPSPLYLNYSDDGGTTWSTPQLTGLYGQAPTWYTLPNGLILSGYRGYTEVSPEVSPSDGGTVAIAAFDPDTGRFAKPQDVVTYTGGRYDGGYMDMIWLAPQQKLLVVYYTSDNQEIRNPWLEYTLLDII